MVFCYTRDDGFFSFELGGEGEDGGNSSCDGGAGACYPIIAGWGVILLEVDVRVDSRSNVGTLCIDDLGRSVSWEGGSEAGYLAIFDADFDAWCEDIAGCYIEVVRTYGSSKTLIHAELMNDK